jgi:Uma2 family endonuclease
MAVDAMATRRRFTRAEYARMAEAGVFRECERVELIEGEIVQLSPRGRHHRAFVNNLTRLLARRLPEHALVSVQNPLPLDDDTEPQPDLAVLRVRAVSFKNLEASAPDALLVIEVAETSLAYDRAIKGRLYARAGVPEYWVVDCAAETVEVHRDPMAEGYRDVRLVRGSAEVSLRALPDVVLRTADIFA